MQSRSMTTQQCTGRRGFTLVEMIVSIGILLILTVTAVSLFNVSVDSDRIRSSARQIQSYIEGARDRAILSREPRGVRFLFDPNAPPGTTLVRSMIFIGAPGRTTGKVRIYSEEVDVDGDGKADTVNEDTNGNGVLDMGEDVDGDGILDVDEDINNNGILDTDAVRNQNGQTDDGVILVLDTTNSQYPVFQNEYWSSLYLRDLLVQGARITLYELDGGRPTVHVVDPTTFSTGAINNNEILLSAPAPWFDANSHNGERFTFELELAPAVLPNQEPVALGTGIAVNLDVSRALGKLPSSWLGRNGTYPTSLDLMFSPRGTVTGPAAAAGLIHFYLADVADMEIGIPPGVLTEDRNGNETLDTGEDLNGKFVYNTSTGNLDWQVNGNNQLDIREGDQLVVTLFTRTGHVSTHPVDPTDANSDGYADDLFRFAETGEVSP